MVKEENWKKIYIPTLVWWLVGTDSLNMANSNIVSSKYGYLGPF